MAFDVVLCLIKKNEKRYDFVDILRISVANEIVN